MAALLRAVARRGRARGYVRRLLAAVTATEDGARAAPGPRSTPLSDRELDVLRLLGTDLSGPDIARELIVSLNTVRTHTKNIYAKLGVNNRRAAVRRAEELGLLPRDRRPTAPLTATGGRRSLLAGRARRRGLPDHHTQSPHVVIPAHHLRS